jgi:flagellar basal body-associated protein FliL
MRVLAFVPSDAFLNAWGIFLLLVTVVIVPVVLLLLARLIATAMTINRHAAAAARAAAQIRANSEPAAQLAETLRVAGELLEVARTVEAHGVVLEKVLTRYLPQQVARR